MSKKSIKITCLCDSIFFAEIPTSIDLGGEPEYIEKITNGTFLNFVCPSCKKKHKPEFSMIIAWPEHNVRFDIIPELERGEYGRSKKEKPNSKEKIKTEKIIGYPELAERILVHRDGMEPTAVEAIKYFLHLKAEENYPGTNIDVWYTGLNPESLEFHIHGIKKDEVAVMKVPSATYAKTLADYRNNPKNELFSALRDGSYVSVRNITMKNRHNSRFSYRI